MRKTWSVMAVGLSLAVGALGCATEGPGSEELDSTSTCDGLKNCDVGGSLGKADAPAAGQQANAAGAVAAEVARLRLVFDGGGEVASYPASGHDPLTMVDEYLEQTAREGRDGEPYVLVDGASDLSVGERAAGTLKLHAAIAAAEAHADQRFGGELDDAALAELKLRVATAVAVIADAGGVLGFDGLAVTACGTGHVLLAIDQAAGRVHVVELCH